MKKLLILLSVLLLVLAGCVSADTSDGGETSFAKTEPSETTIDTDNSESAKYSIDEEFVIMIALADDDLLSTFDVLHVAEYGSIRRIRDASDDGLDGVQLVIWTNHNLSNFALMSIANEAVSDELFFIVRPGTLGPIVELRQSEAFVINNYLSSGNLPSIGVVFNDEAGNARSFLIQENFAYPYGSGNLWDILEFECGRDNMPYDWVPVWAQTPDGFQCGAGYGDMPIEDEENEEITEWTIEELGAFSVNGYYVTLNVHLPLELFPF